MSQSPYEVEGPQSEVDDRPPSPLIEEPMPDIEEGLVAIGAGASKKPLLCCCGVCCGIPSLVGIIILLAAITTLGPEEQLVIYTNGGTGKEVVDGGKTFLCSPFKKTERRTAIRLDPREYAKVKNVRTGYTRHHPGPSLLWLDAWEELVGKEQMMVLRAREFTRLHNTFTGFVRVLIGPDRVVPDVHEVAPMGVQQATLIKNTDSLLVLNKTSGELRVVQQEGYFIPEPADEIVEVRAAPMLKQTEYAIVKNNRTGVYRNVPGPTLLFIEAYDHIVNVRNKLVLQKNEYVRFVDVYTGFARVVQGPIMIVPEPPEDGPGGKDHDIQTAIVISAQTSVVIMDNSDGTKRLVQEPGLFTPGPYEDVVEVRSAQLLKSQEYAVVQDDLTGKFLHYPGPQQLFTGAYEQLVHVLPKIVLQKQQYVVLVDRRSGEETIMKGPETIVPAPEQCEKDYLRQCNLTVHPAIVMKADTAVLILNKTSGARRVVQVADGGIFTPQAYEEIIDVRTAVVLKAQEYAVVKNDFDGSRRHALGPQLLQVDAYEEVIEVRPKVSLARFEYLRLENEQTGVEVVVEGPIVVVPDPMEVSAKTGEANGPKDKKHDENVQNAVLVDADHAVLAMNQVTGQLMLNTTEGMWVPRPYEYFVELRDLIRVMGNEAVVVRSVEGDLTVYDGTQGGAGAAFFLPPRSQIFSMSWTVYGEPAATGEQTATALVVDKIDMRIQRTFYSYGVRTNDNVQLMLMGTIFWRVKNVSVMILKTSDPSGDVWHHSRSSFIQALSNTTFNDFMGSFNTLAKEAFARDTADGFYEQRGLEVSSMEVTRFEAVDEETRETLRRINEETTNQITLLKKQEGENAVAAAKMRSDIALEEERTKWQLELEQHRTDLLKLEAENKLMESRINAQADAQPFAQHASTFISALNDTGVTLGHGLSLYRSLREAEHHNQDTHNLASGKGTFLLTSPDLKLNLRNLNLGGANSSDGGYGYDHMEF